MDLPVLLTADEVRKLGHNPDDLEKAGSYYSPDLKNNNRMIEKPLYRSRDLVQELGEG